MMDKKRQGATWPKYQPCYTQLQLNDRLLKRVLPWPGNGAISRQESSVDPDGVTVIGCRVRASDQCLVKLDVIIDLLRALLDTPPRNAIAAEPGNLEALSRLAHGADTSAGSVYKLTPREGEVLSEMIEGKSNGQIAAELVLSVSTVKCHVSNILAKMGAESRTEAVAMALKMEAGASPDGSGADRESNDE